MSYLLDFGGELRRTANVRLATGISAVEVRVPTSTPARIITKSVLAGLDVGDGFTRHQGAFRTRAALHAVPAVLTISANVTQGSLRLRTT